MKAKAKAALWDKFVLQDHIRLVSGTNRRLRLKMALMLIEAGMWAAYCIDVPMEPGEEW